MQEENNVYLQMAFVTSVIKNWLMTPRDAAGF
jgi:hypothetical protein